MIQFRSQRRLHPDDFILMLACAALIASQILLYVHKIDVIYYQTGRLFDPVSRNILSSSSVVDNGNNANAEEIHRRAANLQQILFSSLALSWTCIYAVKICFLLFFHQLITRLRRWILAWKIIFAITIVFWAFCASAVFIGCPRFNKLSCTSVISPPSPPLSPRTPNSTPFWITAPDKRSACKVRHLVGTLLSPFDELF